MLNNLFRDLTYITGIAIIMSISIIISILMISSPLNDYSTKYGNILIYTGILILITFIVLVSYWLKFEKLIKITTAILIFSTLFYVFISIIILLVPYLSLFICASIAGFIALLVSLIRIYYPEWFIVDLNEAIIAAAGSIIIGIVVPTMLSSIIYINSNYMINPFIFLFIILLITAYNDYRAVYKSNRMIGIFDIVVKDKIPQLFIIPKTRNFSYITATVDSVKEQMVLGIGDIIMPVSLVIFSYTFIKNPSIFNIPILTITTSIGILCSLYIAYLSPRLTNIKFNAGLPFLNSGAILGLFIGVLIWH